MHKAGRSRVDWDRSVAVPDATIGKDNPLHPHMLTALVDKIDEFAAKCDAVARSK